MRALIILSILLLLSGCGLRDVIGMFIPDPPSAQSPATFWDVLTAQSIYFAWGAGGLLVAAFACAFFKLIETAKQCVVFAAMAGVTGLLLDLVVSSQWIFVVAAWVLGIGASIYCIIKRVPVIHDAFEDVTGIELDDNDSSK